MSTIRLTSREAAVLAAVELEAELPLAEVAARVGIPSYTAAYTVARLKRRGLLGPKRPIVDLSAAGYVDYTLFFSVESRRESHRRTLLAFLNGHPGVSWIAEVGGRFQFAAALLARSVSAVQEFLQLFPSKSGTRILAKEISVRLSIQSFGRSYLSAAKRRPAAAVRRPAESGVELDELDRRLLHALCNLECKSRRDAARLLGEPLTTIERRVKSLESRGVMRGWYYQTDGLKLGRQVYLLLVHSRGLDAAFVAALEQFARTHPRIAHLVSCIGPWEHEVVAECDDAAALSELTGELYERCGDGIEHLEVIPLLGYLKYSAFPFAPGPARRPRA